MTKPLMRCRCSARMICVENKWRCYGCGAIEDRVLLGMPIPELDANHIAAKESESDE